MKITISEGQETIILNIIPPPELRQLPELRSSGSSNFGDSRQDFCASGQDIGDSGQDFGDSGQDFGDSGEDFGDSGEDAHRVCGDDDTDVVPMHSEAVSMVHVTMRIRMLLLFSLLAASAHSHHPET